MKIYRDKALTEEIREFNVGTVPAGDTEKFSYWVKNDTNANLINLDFRVANPELKIVRAPSEMKADEVSELEFEWQCAVDIEAGIQAQLRITGHTIWG